MFLIRFFFYAVLTYFILKLVRVLTDPILPQTKKAHAPASEPNINSSPKPKQSNSTLGDYVDFEEIKS